MGYGVSNHLSPPNFPPYSFLCIIGTTVCGCMCLFHDVLLCYTPPPPLSLSPGVTFSLNGVSIPNNNISRISVTDFTVSTRNSDGLQCHSECTEGQISQNAAGYLVPDGGSLITSGYTPLIIS